MKTPHVYFPIVAAVMLLLGVGLCGAFLMLNLDSFPKGMCAGAGVTLIIGSVYVAGRYVWPGRGRDGAERTTWLPSRDNPERP